MPRRNHSKRKPQNRRVLGTHTPTPRPFDASGRPLAPLIKPDAICHGNPLHPKHAFVTEGKAAQALRNAQANHRALGEKVEERFYECDYGNAHLVAYSPRVDLSKAHTHYHLTSQPARPGAEESA